MNKPHIFNVRKDHGSAYYMTLGDHQFPPVLIQVPLGPDGAPEFEDTDEGMQEAGFFGGAEVDWARGVPAEAVAGLREIETELLSKRKSAKPVEVGRDPQGDEDDRLTRP